VPEGMAERGREATLLKLSCDKALFHLGWRAALLFPETVEFVVDWYRAWHEQRTDMVAFTESQIDRYSALAAQRGITWAAQ